MQTRTITYLKEHANKLDLSEPLVVTQKGKAKYVVQDYQDYQDYLHQQESIALLKLLVLSEHSGKIQTLNIDEAFED